jgi:hypothetical protein
VKMEHRRNIVKDYFEGGAGGAPFEARKGSHLVLEFSVMFDLFREELPVPVLADRDGVGLSDRSHLGPSCPFLSSITLQRLHRTRMVAGTAWFTDKDGSDEDD